MVSVDTNIIVRFLTQDDEVQFKQSEQIFQTQDIFIPDTVILETEWVLRFAYKFRPPEISEAFRTLFGLPNVYLTNAFLIGQALQWLESGLDFADALHLSSSQQCTEFFTFDDHFVKKGKNLTPCLIKKL